MILYPLPPQELDDKTLDKQIKRIAQTLLEVHWHLEQVDINKFIEFGFRAHFTRFNRNRAGKQQI